MPMAYRFSFLVLLSLALFPVKNSAQNFVDIKPSPQQVAWQDLEIGAIFHFSTNTFLDREWGDGTASPSVFNPGHVDAEQWIEAVKAAGAKYVILVAKHHDGFCLWPTKLTDYSVKSSPWERGKGDLVHDVAEAARKYGLKFGIYLSPWDRHDPRYADSAVYDTYYLGQLDELASNYGELVEFWMDGAGSAGHTYDFDKIVQQLRMWQPNTLVFADVALYKYADLRWVGNEEGRVNYENWNVVDRAGYLRWRPVEADTPLRNAHWFWHPNDEKSLKSLAELVDTYDETVGHGAQLMLGIAPDREGRVPEADVARLKEFGEAIRQRYSHNLMKDRKLDPTVFTTNEALDDNPETFWSAPAGSHRAMIHVTFKQPMTFDCALTMEWLNDGQHVQKYAIEVLENGKWKRVVEGQAIGHKKIDHFPPVTAQEVRLNLLDTTSEAHIREFQLYNLSASYKTGNQ
ncbi:MAG TPA: alpha-L-fucosidase [Candidatus Sulfotelmatobacter sp.]|nr:alpha-L-fucosidase [Candidatus Sulfotelmatobacter sp.]